MLLFAALKFIVGIVIYKKQRQEFMYKVSKKPKNHEEFI